MLLVVNITPKPQPKQILRYYQSHTSCMIEIALHIMTRGYYILWSPLRWVVVTWRNSTYMILEFWPSLQRQKTTSG